MRVFDDKGKLVTSVADQGIEILCLETFSRITPLPGIYVKHYSDGYVELLVPLTKEIVEEIKANGGVENVDILNEGKEPETPSEPEPDPLPVDPMSLLDLKQTVISHTVDAETKSFVATLQLLQKDGEVYLNTEENIIPEFDIRVFSINEFGNNQDTSKKIDLRNMYDDELEAFVYKSEENVLLNDIRIATFVNGILVMNVPNVDDHGEMVIKLPSPETRIIEETPVEEDEDSETDAEPTKPKRTRKAKETK